MLINELVMIVAQRKQATHQNIENAYINLPEIEGLKR